MDFCNIIKKVLIMRILIVLLLVMFTGCLGDKKKLEKEIKKQAESALTTKSKGIDKPSEEQDVLSAMTSKPIILITTLFGIGLFLAAGLAMYRAKPVLSLSLIGSGVLVIGIPIIVVMMFKAMLFLLYLFCGLIIVLIFLGAYILWRRLEAKHKVNESFVRFIAEAKGVVDAETWLKLKAIADKVKCDTATKEVNKIREKLKL